MPRAKKRVRKPAKKKQTTFSIATSLNQKTFQSPDVYVYGSVEKNMPKIPLFVYHENSFEKRNGLSGIRSLESDRPCIREFDLFEIAPDMERISAGEIAISDEPWLRKVFAVAEAVNSCETDYLVWIDSDVEILKPLDAAFWAWVKKFDIAYIHRNVAPRIEEPTDTGLIAFKICPKVKKYVADFLQYYKSGDFINEVRWDDGFIFSRTMDWVRNDNLKKGWLANNRLKSDADNVSPFDISDYIIHHKVTVSKIMAQVKENVVEPPQQATQKQAAPTPGMRPDPTQRPKSKFRIRAG